MQTRSLGNDHLAVSAIGLGCWGMSNAYGPADEKESLATLELAVEQGITFWDTADVYGDGHNERLISAVLKKHRSRIVLATKFGFVGDEHGNVGVDGRPAHVYAACDRSLERLGTDIIDLYYLHRLDRNVPIEETVGAMGDLVRQGKVRCIGLSEVSTATLRRAHAEHPITALQSEYSLWHREVEKEILPTCRELGIAFIPFSPLGRGYLAGGVLSDKNLSPDDYRRNLPRFQPEAMDRNREMVAQLLDLAEAGGHTPSQLSLAWLLNRDRCIVPIPGMKRRAHLLQNAAAADIELTARQMAKLDAIGRNAAGERHNPHNLQFVDR